MQEQEAAEVTDLRSLGINPKRKKELNDKKELEELADNIKQSMFQDYKTACSRKGRKYEKEAKSTLIASVLF
ncbi:hypothetical protein NTE_00517 [Candidatus Nitrososphaera evergladensis SR1]|jgi:hypothetical protein|uniref:Uncharacterized protein n=1 Tax=Candidatus Nitrososphaera evergladensis SR1 TaxID=1459636 RepID=A0A075MMU6_9ARCH|nr:hypothetical protein [Candidatus Nitrososphaera evergladensis]AIF82598.1 hypothetical protein NTE_00517 [Candidatus Nitrososphaera evergladensis SR1]